MDCMRRFRALHDDRNPWLGTHADFRAIVRKASTSLLPACTPKLDFISSSVVQQTMSAPKSNGTNGVAHARKKILINAFDMSTVGHLSPGQWKNPKDKSATKRKLDYWIELAKLLERGGINALFLADTYGGYDTYESSLDNCIKRAAQWPMTDPSIVCARVMGPRSLI